jgi:hypothetical protein
MVRTVRHVIHSPLLIDRRTLSLGSGNPTKQSVTEKLVIAVFGSQSVIDLPLIDRVALYLPFSF